jgi:hypothetical protein
MAKVGSETGAAVIKIVTEVATEAVKRVLLG